MKSFRRHPATVNAGSMADIAFLLLIFFLVTTTISAEKGILRQLPNECPPNEDCAKDIPERNLLSINLNSNQEIMVNEKRVKLEDIKELVKKFLDNNGKSYCSYCEGQRLETSSDHPREAVISLSHDALTSYALYINVQDEIANGYYDLRERYIRLKFNKTPDQITDEEFKEVKNAYPFIVSEFMMKHN